MTSIVRDCDVDEATCSGGACAYQVGDMTCGCPGYVPSYNGDCATCAHPRSSHW